jgi:hypothetical protein
MHIGLKGFQLVRGGMIRVNAFQVTSVSEGPNSTAIVRTSDGEKHEIDDALFAVLAKLKSERFD